MTGTPIGTRLVLKYRDGSSYSLPGIRNGLADINFFNTALSVNALQQNSAQYIYRAEDTELTAE